MHDHGQAGALSAAGHHRGRLALALGITAAFLIVEAVAAGLTGSLVLLSDAGHMLSDVAALGMTLAAVSAGHRSTRPGQTFGLYRLEVLAALANAVLLLGVAAYVLVEVVSRLADPPDLTAAPVLFVALAGLAVNGVALVLLRPGASASLTLQAASTEVLADALGSIGAVLAAVVLATTGWPYADPLVAAVIAAFIVPRALSLGRRALRVLVQAAPEHLDPDDVRAALASVDGVVEVHDLHLWTLTSGMDVASAHLVTPPGGDLHGVLDRARHLLSAHYGIEHATLQVEPSDHTGCEQLRW